MTSILRIRNISIGEVVVQEIHVDVFVGAFCSNGLPDLMQRLSLIFGFDVIRKYALTVVLTTQHPALGVCYLVSQGRHILARAVVQAAIGKAAVARGGKSLTKPLSRIQHQQFGIIIRLHIIRLE